MKSIVSLMLALTALLTFVGCAHQPSELELTYTAQICEWVPGMAAEKIPARQESQQKLEQLCFVNSTPGMEKEREALCYAMMSHTGVETPLEARAWILRKVETIGKDEVIPTLVALMDDDDARIRELARRALANNPCGKAAKALRKDLQNTECPRRQIAQINNLAWRGDDASTCLFIEFASHENDDVALAAISGLGVLGTDDAVDALEDMLDSLTDGNGHDDGDDDDDDGDDDDDDGIVVRPALRDQVIGSCLLAGAHLMGRDCHKDAAELYLAIYDATTEEHYHIAAMTGYTQAAGSDAIPFLVKLFGSDNPRISLVAFRCAQGVTGSAATQALIAAMDGATTERQVMILEVIGSRGDRSAINVVHAAAKSDDSEIRVAALDALATVGDSSSVMLLAKAAAKTDSDAERSVARQSLSVLQGADVNRVILEGIAKTGGAVRAELILAVASRKIEGGTKAVLAVKNDKDPAVRGALIVALGKVGSSNDLPGLIAMLKQGITEASRTDAENAIVEIVLRSDDKAKRTEPLLLAIADADVATQASLVRILGQVKDRAAVAAIRKALASDDSGVSGAAKQALSAWPVTYVTKWLVSPKYDTGKDPKESFGMAFGPEKGEAVEWKPLTERENGQRSFVMALHKAIPGQNCVGYVKTMIHSPGDMKAQLLFGSDDGIKVWVNDVVVLESNEIRGVTPGEDVADVQLKKGWNTVMLKVTQGGADWSFCCAIRAADGGPILAMKNKMKVN